MEIISPRIDSILSDLRGQATGEFKATYADEDLNHRVAWMKQAILALGSETRRLGLCPFGHGLNALYRGHACFRCKEIGRGGAVNLYSTVLLFLPICINDGTGGDFPFIRSYSSNDQGI